MLTGVMNFCGQSGAFLMSMIFGRVVDATHSFEAPQYLMAIVLTIGGICWLGINASKKIIGEPTISPVQLVAIP